MIRRLDRLGRRKEKHARKKLRPCKALRVKSQPQKNQVGEHRRRLPAREPLNEWPRNRLLHPIPFAMAEPRPKVTADAHLHDISLIS